VTLPPVQNILGYCKQFTPLINYQVNPPEIHLCSYTNAVYPSSFFQPHLFYLSNIPAFFPKFVGSTPCIVQAVCIVWLGSCDKCNLTFIFLSTNFENLAPQ
jgi:hypothetical protein